MIVTFLDFSVVNTKSFIFNLETKVFLDFVFVCCSNIINFNVIFLFISLDFFTIRFAKDDQTKKDNCSYFNIFPCKREA